MMKSISRYKIGLVDADLLSGGTRHPNLMLLKIAGFLNDNRINFNLIFDPNTSIEGYDYIYMSKVFSFTPNPSLYENAGIYKSKFVLGGTGFYMEVKDTKKFHQERINDIKRLEQDPFLNSLNNYRSNNRKYGIDLANQMPYYKLYDEYIAKRIKDGKKEKYFDDYKLYSIGFLTRGCIRHCPFCVNKHENNVRIYSSLDSFLDEEKNEKGQLVRPYIYLWDDNFLAAPRTVWEPLLKELIKSNRPFQFRQGLDERIFAEKEDGEYIAELLSKCKYKGDFIFAFDNWRDREKIENALRIWKKYNHNKSTKFYLFCGFRQTKYNMDAFYKDIWELFQRIKILMMYGCLGYVMRHEDYHNSPLENFYIQVARWCNQPQFYKKMSFWEFVYRNQSYWEEKTLGITNQPKIISYDDYICREEKGYYLNVRKCKPIQTIEKVFEMYPEHKHELLEMFNYKMMEFKNSKM